jgi:peptidyl-prolyl cis-trans isomerase D
MLESFRNASQTWFIKILFAFLILSFGIWGVGDVIRERVAAQPAISVGDKEYSGPEVAERFRRDVERMSSMFGTKLTVEQAMQFGLLQQTVQRLVDAALLDQAATEQRLGVDDATLRRTIAEIPAFQSQLKMFDKATYQRVLSSMNMTERQFLRLEKDDLARNILIKEITNGVVAPASLAAPVYRYQSEKRVADFVAFVADKMANPAAPDAAVLQKYYDDHKLQFQQPELRSVTALVVHAADLAATIHPSEEEIDKAYQARLGEFQTPEKRSVEQLLFTDEEAAKAFLEKAGQSKDLAAAAKQENVTLTDLGSVSKTDMPIAELADAAFAAKIGTLTGPVQSPLGWHLLMVTSMTPGKTRPLGEVKDQISAALVKDETTNRLYGLSTKLEDAIGGGNDVNEAAKTIGVKAITLDMIDDHGRDADGKPQLSPALTPAILATIFQTAQGGTSDVIALPANDGYYVVHVDKVVAASVRPFEQVKGAILAAWQAEQRSLSAKQQAEAAMDRLGKGESLAALAGPLKVETTKPFLRAGGTGSVPPQFAAEMFRLPAVGGVTVVANGADYLVARLKEIQSAEAQGAGFDAARNEISQGIADDLMQEYIASLKKHYATTVNMAVINQQFAK